MPSIDKRIVEMEFRNEQFERGAQQTLGSLKNLGRALEQPIDRGGVSHAERGIQALGSAVTSVQTKISALGAVGVGALMQIGSSAAQAGMNMVKSLSVEPIMDGFREYETKLNSVQTILSNTASKGTTIGDVTKNLGELNDYADKTIYNFAEMTRNIGTFTAAGVDLDKSTTAIKGFSNMAALTGASSEDAARGMYQLSQALSTGTVKLMDWKSIENANMGGEGFREALILTAKKFGKNVDYMIKKHGSFRESLSEGWLTDKVMLETLTIMTGDYSQEQIQAMGYSAKAAEKLSTTAKMALESATKVKTLSQLFDVIKESVGSGWSTTFELLFGNYEQASELFTNLYNKFDAAISKSSDARNALIKGWADLGGREDLINSLNNIMTAAERVITPIKNALATIIPPMTAEKLKSITEGFEKFTEKLIISEDTAAKVTQVLIQVFDVVKRSGSIVKSAAGHLLEWASNLSPLYEYLMKAASHTSGFVDQLERLADKAEVIPGIMERVYSKTSEKVSTAFIESARAISGFLTASYNFVKTAAEKISNFFKAFFKELGINSAAEGAKIATFITVATLALKKFAAIMTTITKIATPITGFFKGLRAISDGVREALDLLRTHLKALVLQIKAEAILKIAMAVGVLAAACLILSLIDPDRLVASVVALSTILGEAFGATGGLSKFTQDTNVAGITAAAAALVMMSIAVLILTRAIIKLSAVPTDKLIASVTAVAAIMAVFVASIKVLSDGARMSVRASIAMIGMAMAILLLTAAVKSLSKLSWEELGKGLLAFAGIMTITVKTFKNLVAPAEIMKIAFSIVVLAVAINIMGHAVKKLGEIQFKKIIKGLIALFGILGSLALYMRATKDAVPKSSVATLLALAIAVNLLARSVDQFGKMDLESLAKGIGGVITMLFGIALALKRAEGSIDLKTSIGIIAIAYALTMLSESVMKLGSLKPEQVAQGVGGIIALLASIVFFLGSDKAGKIGITASAGLTMAASALMKISDVVLIFGSMSLEALAKGLVGVAAGLFTLLGAILLLDEHAEDSVKSAVSIYIVAQALVAIATAVSTLAVFSWDQLALGLATLGLSLFAIVQVTKKMKDTRKAAVSLLIVAAALNVLLPVLTTLANFSPQQAITAVLTLAAVFVVLGVAAHFLEPLVPVLYALGGAVLLFGLAVGIAGAGVGLLALGVASLALAFLATGGALAQLLLIIAESLPAFGTGVGMFLVNLCAVIAANAGVIVGMVINLGIAILAGIGSLLPPLAALVLQILATVLGVLVSGIPMIVNAGIELILGLLRGLAQRMPDLINAAADCIVAFLDGIANNIGRIIEAGINLIVKFMEGIANGIRNNKDRIANAAKEIGSAICDGIAGSIRDGVNRVVNAAKGLANDAIQAAKNLLGIHSPSRVFYEIGDFLVQGFANGIEKNGYKASEQAEDTAEDIRKRFEEIVSNIDFDDMDLDPGYEIGVTVDTAQAEAALKSLQDSLSFTDREVRFADSARSLSGQNGSNTQNVVVNNNFEQVINSPKALDDTTIYRNTKSLFAKAAGIKTPTGVV